MDGKTINDSPTIAGNGEAMLANRYRVVRQLGQGGMGSVWLAEDTQLDNRPFAIKMLPSILVSNKRAYRQLKDEALVAMKLTHPNIVTLRAFEENNGNPFLVMDYIDGQTLDDYLADKGTLGEDEVMGVLRPIAAALDYAHGEGVVHRDVKPANVMIRKDGHPFILDFGIAREIQETMTRVTGKLSSGTLLYMSPEQLNGDAPKREQDIYSFAAMAYECLKGEPPFVRGAIEDQIKNKIPESPVGRDDPIAPLSASVMAGLAKEPADRPESCAAVLEGKDSNRVERAERVEGNVSRRDAEAQSGGADAPRPPQENGGARRPAEPVGAYVPRDRTGGSRPVATVAGRRDPTPPNGDGFSHKEHKERKGIGIGKVLGILALLAALGGVGAWYYHQQQEAAARRARAEAQRKSVQKVQLWEGGPYWADRNIGAERPEDYGYHFWWGDTVGYTRVGNAWVASDGSSQNFSFGNAPTFRKDDATLKREGWITDDGVLAPEHDAARTHWGGSWRMPTRQELMDLCDKCDWSWRTVNGVNGYVVRGKGAYASYSIFLPCAGYGSRTSLYLAGSYGYYWSSVPCSVSYSSAWNLYFYSSGFYSSGHDTSNGGRSHGQSVRPVQGFTQ